MNISHWTTPLPSNRTSPNANIRLLSTFAGRYGCQRKSELDLVTVSAATDHLNISSGRGGAELWPTAENDFRSVNANTDLKGKFVFTKNVKGKALNLVILTDDGGKVSCVREE
jgi:hypothetical protein